MFHLILLLKVFFISFLLAISGCDSLQSKDNVINLTILHTNDHHGAYWEDKHGNGGLVNRSIMIEQIRKEVEAQDGIVLLLDAGDVNTGTPESDLLFAEPDFKGMAMLGYDAMTLGNHEFDNSLEILKRQQSWAGFPFLSANIYDSTSNQRAFTPYIFIQKKGLKIGILGLTTVDTKVLGNPNILATLEFKPHISELRKVLNEMKNKEADIIIALSHLGYYYNGDHGSNSPGDISLARGIPTGNLDVIIGGHSHTAVCLDENGIDIDFKPPLCRPDRQNDIWIFQALESGRYIGRADFTWQNGQLNLKKYQLLPVVSSIENKTASSQAVHKVLAELKKPIDLQLTAPLGILNDNFDGDRASIRHHQTNMGRLIVQAQMEKSGADFGLISSGSIRSSFSAGPVSYRDVLKVQPFGNTIVYVELTGKEIIDYLNIVAFKTPGSGAYAQFHNIEFSVENGRVKQVAINGVPLKLNKVYRMSLPSYNAKGGDGYPILSQHHSFVNTGYIDAEVLKTFISRHYPL